VKHTHLTLRFGFLQSPLAFIYLYLFICKDVSIGSHMITLFMYLNADLRYCLAAIEGLQRCIYMITFFFIYFFINLSTFLVVFIAGLLYWYLMQDSYIGI
jgi:hypothetical protein